MPNYIYSTPIEEKGGVGPKYVPSATSRVLTVAEAVLWVDYKVWQACQKRGGKPRYIDSANIKKCIEYIEGYKVGSGGGTGYTFNGHTVYHISHGKKNSTDGCSLFFCLPADKMASIILIGTHAAGSDHTYSIDWVKDGWHDRRLCSTITSK